LDGIRRHFLHLAGDEDLRRSALRSGLRDGFANTGELPAYATVNIGIEHAFKIPGWGTFKARFDIVNLFDKSYEIRDGSGIGVFAPQFGARRGFYGGVSYEF
jgi:outer membrane receptor protein involved in Fe transport